uniref:Calponin-homology (CH) domain-containing protein n=1 Tax=Heterorhabditis bacteriophora TaxID=37862 RepID=A0A1I7WK55_HETBA
MVVANVEMALIAAQRMVDSNCGMVNEEIVEDIDDRRLNRKAYDYLCRLLEVRKWLSECLEDDSIPSVTELENNFRNGVLLARLSNFFAPDIVQLKGIYDLDQEKYIANDRTPQYRHTDNIMQWRRAMESVRLPELFIPETTDVFEGRNMKTTFCLYALATLLYRLRKAPPLRNQAGKAQFTSASYYLFALSELDKIISGDSAEVVSPLRFLDILDDAAREYALELYLSMFRKKKTSNMGRPLNREQVREIIAVANSIAEVKLAVLHGSSEHTLKALENQILELDIRAQNAKLYYNRLFYNYQKSANDFFLSKNDLQNILSEIDDLSTDQMKRALSNNLYHDLFLELNSAVEKGDKITTESLIRELSGDLFIEKNIDYYLQKLGKVKISNLKELTTVVQQTNVLVGKAFQEADASALSNFAPIFTITNVQQQKEEEAIRTIQTSYRKYRNRKDNKELWKCESPELNFLRRFIEHLEDIEIDLTEELEIEESRTRVNQLIVSNRQLDAELCKLDENIELLIKNRLNLQEVIAHKDKIADKFVLRPTTMRKKERDNTKHLEQLFFHLQTDSQYFANLIQGIISTLFYFVFTTPLKKRTVLDEEYIKKDYCMKYSSQIH